MSSTDKVLRTPELLELILLELPLRTLLTRASLVNKQWRDHITSSLPLQRALFFKTCSPGTPSRVNPLMAADFPIFFDGNEHSRFSFDQLPFARSRKDNNSGHSGVADEDDVVEAPSVPPKQLALRAAFLHPSASWRRMMPRQPAVDEPVFWRDVFHRSNRGVGDLRVSCRGNMTLSGYDGVTAHEEPSGASFGSEGWTMGSLYDKACRVAMGRRVFRVFWDAQAYIRREAQMLAEAEEEGYIDTDASLWAPMAEARVHVRHPDGKVPEVKSKMAQLVEGLSEEDEVFGEDMSDVMTLVDAVGEREVIFQTIDQTGCRGLGAGLSKKILSMMASFKRYYAFPAADLDAKPKHPSVDPWRNRKRKLGHAGAFSAV